MSSIQNNWVTIIDDGSARYSQRVIAGRHVLWADEPMDRGGHDTGPSPYEYLLAGLGACTAITVRLYCDRHNWKLRRIMVRVQHDKVLGSDGAPIDHFYRTIYLDGDLTEEQRRKTLQIAEICPVSQTFRHSAVIDSTLASTPLSLPIKANFLEAMEAAFLTDPGR